ncbi:hypothetical protein [Sinomonas sp.]
MHTHILAQAPLSPGEGHDDGTPPSEEGPPSSGASAGGHASRLGHGV